MRWLIDDELSIFESEIILLHMGGRSMALLPADPLGRAAPRRAEAVA